MHAIGKSGSRDCRKYSGETCPTGDRPGGWESPGRAVSSVGIGYAVADEQEPSVRRKASRANLTGGRTTAEGTARRVRERRGTVTLSIALAPLPNRDSEIIPVRP